MDLWDTFASALISGGVESGFGLLTGEAQAGDAKAALKDEYKYASKLKAQELEGLMAQLMEKLKAEKELAAEQEEGKQLRAAYESLLTAVLKGGDLKSNAMQYLGNAGKF